MAVNAGNERRAIGVDRREIAASAQFFFGVERLSRIARHPLQTLCLDLGLRPVASIDRPERAQSVGEFGAALLDSASRVSEHLGVDRQTIVIPPVLACRDTPLICGKALDDQFRVRLAVRGNDGVERVRHFAEAHRSELVALLRGAGSIDGGGDAQSGQACERERV